MAILAALGAVADLLVLCLLGTLGRWVGLGGGFGAVTVLRAHLVTMVSGLRSPWAVWVALGSALALAVVVARRRASLVRFVSGFWVPVRQPSRCPGRMAAVLAGSGATTLLLGIAFVATTSALPGPGPHASAGALIVGFMVGSAAASAVPVPAGLGSTEAALVAVLVGATVPVGHAVAIVLLYRALTFWLPALVGVVLLRPLRRRQAI